MIRICYSNRPARLLDRLGADISRSRLRDGPWAPIHVAVPNRHQEGAIRRFLAEKELETALAVSANLRFWFLDELLGAGLPPRVRVLGRAALQGLLLRRFQAGAGLDHPDLAPVRRYLEGPAPERRVAQLASRLAQLFEDYLLSRPGWFAVWEAEAGAAGLDPLERCQARLWRDLRADLAGAEETWILPHQARERLRPGLPGLPRELRVFGMGPTAVVYHAFLAALAGQGAEVRIFALNPCREFWDDTPGSGSRRDQGPARPDPDADPEDPFGLLDPRSQEQPLLRRWGRPGRELLHLLNQLGDWDFEPAFEDPGRATLLAALQQDVLEHAAPRPVADPAGAAADGSVRVHDCPTPAREAETLAEEIWDLVDRARGALRFSDIAVILPPADRERTLAHLRAAFQGEPAIPIAEAEQPAPALGDLAEGLRALLDLVGHGSTRGRVLDLLGRPALRRRLEEGDPDRWADWCRRLGIVRGWDRASLVPTYFDEDLLTWDQGLRRLALGAFMEEAGAPFEAAGQAYGIPPLGPDDRAVAGRFMEALDRLRRDLADLEAGVLPLAAWSRRLIEVAEQWLGGEEGADRQALGRLQGALAGLGNLEPEGLRGTAYPFGVARELAGQALDRLLAQGQGFRPDGVVVGTYAALRGLSFQVVLLPGLGEGRFPSQAAPDDLDLRARSGQREAGDILPYERDRYTFLETLLGAERRVVLSWLGRHPVTGERLAPSPVLAELLEVLRAMLPGAAVEAPPLRYRHPLRRWDPDRFRPGGWGHLQREAVAREFRADQGLEAEPPAPAVAAAEDRAEPRTVTLAQIARFLKSPLQGAAATALGLREDEADEAWLEAEPAGTAFLDRLALRRRALRDYLLDPAAGTLEAAYRRLRAQAAGAARVGLGALGAPEVEQDLALLERWDRCLPPGPAPVRTRFGAGDGEPVLPGDRILPELRFRLPRSGRTDLEVRVGGATEPWGGAGPLVPLAGGPPRALEDRVKQALKGWVDHLALRAADWQADPDRAGAPAPAAVQLLPGDGAPQPALLPLPAVSPRQGHDLLAGLLADLFGGGHGHLLPVEKLAAADCDYARYRQWLEDYDGASGHDRISCAYGPIQHPETLPPAPEAAFEAARARLRPLLDAFREDRP